MPDPMPCVNNDPQIKHNSCQVRKQKETGNLRLVSVIMPAQRRRQRKHTTLSAVCSFVLAIYIFSHTGAMIPPNHAYMLTSNRPTVSCQRIIWFLHGTRRSLPVSMLSNSRRMMWPFKTHPDRLRDTLCWTPTGTAATAKRWNQDQQKFGLLPRKYRWKLIGKVCSSLTRLTWLRPDCGACAWPYRT